MAPASVADVLDATERCLRKAFRPLGELQGPVVIGAVGSAFALTQGSGRLFDLADVLRHLRDGTPVGASRLVDASYLLSTAGLYVVLATMSVLVAHAASEGERLPAQEVWRRAWSRLGAVAGVLLVLWLPALLALATLLVLPPERAPLALGIAAGLRALLLGLFALALPYAALDGRGWRGSLAASLRDARGSRLALLVCAAILLAAVTVPRLAVERLLASEAFLPDAAWAFRHAFLPIAARTGFLLAEAMILTAFVVAAHRLLGPQGEKKAPGQ